VRALRLLADILLDAQRAARALQLDVRPPVHTHVDITAASPESASASASASAVIVDTDLASVSLAAPVAAVAALIAWTQYYGFRPASIPAPETDTVSTSILSSYLSSSSAADDVIFFLNKS
jgi:hypothetical protein